MLEGLNLGSELNLNNLNKSYKSAAAEAASAIVDNEFAENMS